MANVTEQTFELKTADTLSLAATLFQPKSQETNKALVIGSALGVPRYFYFKIAHFLQKTVSRLLHLTTGVYTNPKRTICRVPK